MKRDFNSIKSNTDDREESSWFVLLFFNPCERASEKNLLTSSKEKSGVCAT